jgi:uncharacterized membrane protein YphA (DoxX/SURF4 family)
VFRAVAIYAVLYTLPGIFAVVPGLEWLADLYDSGWKALIERLADTFQLDVLIQAEENGSGDTSAAYLTLVCELAVAAIGAAVWSALDRSRTAHPRAAQLLRVYLRFVLAYSMMWYGLAKILKSQFPFPTPGRLMQPFGEASPMGLLWTFMGYSTAYTVFAGVAELTGGLLLLWRRTTALGALLLVIVLSHVVLLNFTYDVPVKLYSLHLLAIAVLLLLPHAGRLIDVLVRNRATEPVDLGRFPAPPRWHRALRIGKVLVVALMLFTSLHESWRVYTELGDGADRHPLYGAYDVERPGASADDWRHVAVSNRGFTVMTMDERVVRHKMTYDEEHAELTITGLEPDTSVEVWAVMRPDPDTLELVGQNRSHRLVRRPPTLLESRGFHWVNESPYNR